MKGLEIDLSNLPQDNKGNVIWSKTIGEMIPFIYNSEVGYLKVVGFCKQQVTLELDGRIRRFHVRDIYYNHIEPLIGVYTQKFLYEVGDVIGDYEVVEQIFISQQTENTENKQLKGQQERRYRGYLVKCSFCGKEYKIKQKIIINGVINMKCNCNKKIN